jgi:hypothetical protein
MHHRPRDAGQWGSTIAWVFMPECAAPETKGLEQVRLMADTAVFAATALSG